MNIRWIGHASVLLEGKSSVAVDPWKIRDKISADIILITHSHYDHFSMEDISRISGPQTVVAGPADVTEQITGMKTRTVGRGDVFTEHGVTVTAVPAYNIGKNFHPKENGWLGYVVEMEGESVYIAGDTDLIPEMDSIRADTAILPVGGTYTMDASEAAEAVRRIGASTVIPYHYGDIVGGSADADLFASKVKGAQVRILSP